MPHFFDPDLAQDASFKSKIGRAQTIFMTTTNDDDDDVSHIIDTQRFKTYAEDDDMQSEIVR